MTSEEYKEEIQILDGTKVVITTYRIGDEFHCHVSNYDPGATIARAHAAMKEAAVNEAVKKATERILRHKK